MSLTQEENFMLVNWKEIDSEDYASKCTTSVILRDYRFRGISL